MELLELIKKLIEFQSYTGNQKAINDCLKFCINYFIDKNNVYIKQIEINKNKSVLISNIDTSDFDVLEVCHIDVVPVNNTKQYIPNIIDNIMYARGSGDMKGFVAVAIKLFEYAINNNFNLKYGLLIVSDEEPGGFNGAKYWTENLNLKTKILLDADAGNNLNTIISKSKASFFVKLISNGKSAHGSKPWLGNDAIENLIQTINNLRKFFSYYSINNLSINDWITTMHIGTIIGGEAENSIAKKCQAVLDFRYTEKYNDNSILDIIKNCLVPDVDVVIQENGYLVNNDINNKYLQMYKNIIEKKTKKEVKFDFSSVASDSRYFSTNKDTIIISNQADCGDLHGDNEWLNIKKLELFFEIRKEFIDSLNSI